MSVIQSERFKDLSATFQNCVVSIAVLVGGGWALYRFIATHEIERAKLELSKQAQILIKITASDVVLDDGKHCIASIVGITNNGTRNVLLDYSNGPFSITKVNFGAEGNSSLGTEVRQESLLSKSRVLRFGESVEYPFFVRVQGAGLYVVKFQVPLPENEMMEHLSALPKKEILEQRADDPQGKIYWFGTTFVNINTK